MMEDIVEESKDISNMIFLFMIGGLKTKNSDKQNKNAVSVYFIPNRFINSSGAILVGGNYFYKGKPVMTSFSSSKYDVIIRKHFKISTNNDIITELRSRVPNMDFAQKSNSLADELSVGGYTNSEIVDMLITEEITIEDLSSLPNNRVAKLKQIMSLME